mgnify:FL=1
MEQDGKTRIYVCGGGNGDPRLRELFPNLVNFLDDESAIVGVQAFAILGRVDYYGVSHRISERTSNGRLGKTLKVGYGFRDKENIRFDISTMDWKHDDEDKNLASELERKSGKTGLTIVIS